MIYLFAQGCCLRDPSAPLRFARDDNAWEAERQRGGGEAGCER